MVHYIVCHENDILVKPIQKVHVWVRHVVSIIPSINLKFLAEAEETLWDEI